MSHWADVAWRVPCAFLIRAPLIVVGLLLTWVGERLEQLGQDVPGLPDGVFKRLH